jgi:hypothetical protein
MKKSLVWLGACLVIALCVIYIAYSTNCKLEKRFRQGFNHKNMHFAKAVYHNDLHGRTADQFLIVYKGTKVDTMYHFFLCKDWYNSLLSTSRFERKEFWVIYSDFMKDALPIWTKESYKLAKEHFPKNCGLVDTSIFY